ncbi:GA module [Anaerococcus octavius]|uniref:GA module n=1 Tax=Anaerococcus octavius TaxID=54007 RepID=A0A380WWR4_9FIRM|nr:GA module-containing protein [Anaerococcus octavius]SUU93405.1 GA module [Anaerococcus octavius]
MKKKSILIASLSLGLIFGIANTPTYASANEITQEQKDEFHRRKTDEVLAQLKAKDKDAAANLLAAQKELESEKDNLSKKEEELGNLEKAKIEKENQLDQSKENNDSEEVINKLQNELDQINNDINQKNEEITLLNQSIKEKDDKVNLLDKEKFRIHRLSDDYSHATNGDPFLLDKAEARYDIRGYEIQGLINEYERNTYINEVNVTQNKEELEAKLAEIKGKIGIAGESTPEKEKEVLNKTKEDALSKLNEKENLSQEQKEDFKVKIESVENIEDLKTINKEVEKAEADAKAKKDAEKLKAFKESSKRNIEKKEYLSQENKKELLDQIESAETLEKIEAILKEADLADKKTKEEKDNSEVAKKLESSKESAKQNIESKDHLTPEQIKEFKNQVDSAESVEKINEILDKVGAADKKSQKEKEEKTLEKSKKEIKDKLNNNNLDQDDKESFAKKIDQASNLEILKNIEEQINAASKKQGKTDKNNKDSSKLDNKEEKTSKPAIKSLDPIKENTTSKEDTIIVAQSFRYIKKGSYKVSDLKAKRDRLEKSIDANKATVRAIQLLEELAPRTVAKNRSKVDKLLKESQRLLKEASYALDEYNYLLSK